MAAVARYPSVAVAAVGAVAAVAVAWARLSEEGGQADVVEANPQEGSERHCRRVVEVAAAAAQS